MLELVIPEHTPQQVETLANGFRLNGQRVQPEIERLSAHSIRLRLQNRDYVIIRLGYDKKEHQLRLRVNGKVVPVAIHSLEDRLLERIGIDRAELTKVAELRAPMPGLVRDILVKPDQEVQEGDPLLVLEAMKMENVIKSPTAGTVASIAVESGQTVEKNDLLVGFA